MTVSGSPTLRRYFARGVLRLLGIRDPGIKGSREQGTEGNDFGRNRIVAPASRL